MKIIKKFDPDKNQYTVLSVKFDPETEKITNYLIFDPDNKFPDKPDDNLRWIGAGYCIQIDKTPFKDTFGTELYTGDRVCVKDGDFHIGYWEFITYGIIKKDDFGFYVETEDGERWDVDEFLDGTSQRVGNIYEG